ncbi:alpha-2,8-polysialyltransferase family protein [Arenibacter sp. F26102]|uniref:alpha-2,8-polysialyltransferase family protein n=1 Tax=Arenibacter sp. F26102 TaxID=2926416 RepID=UPI001FF6B362|nr:alpha-2,8-polysialyltransferase family protein [Arenibacter sp. F26102]MCK0144099.1 alpha-2,8-polysialyltransferase family protein [Arenibacter sp. F26102]
MAKLIEDGFICDYLDTNNIFFQDLEFPKGIKTLSFSDIKLRRSFYNISSLKRMQLVYGLRNRIKDITEKYDSFVFGNDGAIQRQFIYFAKKKNKPCSMILDGLINDPVMFNLLDIVKYSKNKLADIKELYLKKIVLYVSKAFATTKCSPYLPSTIACSNLNVIYTIGEFSGKAIRKYAHQRTSILNTGLPRMISYFRSKPKSFIPKHPKSICFITSAYKWHGLLSYHQYQIKDILLLRRCLDELYPNEGYTLYIKLHPRENPMDYIQFENVEDLILVENEPFIETISNYKVLLSNLSTCIVEGINLGVNVGSLMINFPYWKVKNGFLKNDSIIKYFTEEELKSHLKNQFKFPEVFYNDSSNNVFLSHDTPLSVERISEDIKSLF